jgi:hypothetical protein
MSADLELYLTVCFLVGILTVRICTVYQILTVYLSIFGYGMCGKIILIIIGKMYVKKIFTM